MTLSPPNMNQLPFLPVPVSFLSTKAPSSIPIALSTVCAALCAVLFCYSPVFLLSSSCSPRAQLCSCFFPVFPRSSFHITAHPVCSAAPSGELVLKIASSPPACRFPSGAAPLLPSPSSSLCACLRVPPPAVLYRAMMRVISLSVAFPFLYPFPVLPVLFSPVDASLPSSVLFRGLMRGKQVLRWPAIHQLHQHGLAFPSISLAWLFLPSALPGFPFQSEWAGLICLPSAWPGFSFHQHGLAFPSISMAWLSSLPSAWPGFPFLYPFQVPPLPQSLHFYPSTLSSCLQYCSEC